MKMMKTIVLGLSLLTFSACNSDSSSNNIDKTLVGIYSCQKGMEGSALELFDNGKFEYTSYDNPKGYKGDWESVDEADKPNSFITKKKLSSGKYRTTTHNYQKQQNGNLVVQFNIQGKRFTCKLVSK